MYIFLEPSCELKKNIRSIFIILKNISVFDLLFIIGMVSHKVLVLVKLGNTKIFFSFFYQRRYEWGVFSSRFKADISCLIPSLSWNKKKAQKLSQSKEVFFLKSSPHEAWEGISVEGRQNSGGRFIQGTHFSRKDWPQHPWPAGQAAFSLPGAFVFQFGPFFNQEKKAKAFETKTCTGNLVTVLVSLFIITQLTECSVLCVCVLMSMYNLYYYYFCTWLLSCSVHQDAKNILEIKISTGCAHERLQMEPCSDFFLFLYLFNWSNNKIYAYVFN